MYIHCTCKYMYTCKGTCRYMYKYMYNVLNIICIHVMYMYKYIHPHVHGHVRINFTCGCVYIISTCIFIYSTCTIILYMTSNTVYDSKNRLIINLCPCLSVYWQNSSEPITIGTLKILPTDVKSNKN